MRWAVAFAAVAVMFPPAAAADQIEITARLQHSNTARLLPTGRAGDATSSRWILRDRYAAVIGEMLIDCRWVTAGLRLCIGQVTLPLGALAFLGASRTKLLGQFGVVGGTGRYVGADGTLLFNAVGTNQYVLSINYRKETP